MSVETIATQPATGQGTTEQGTTDSAWPRSWRSFTLEEKVQLLTGRDFWTTWPLEKIGLRRMLFSDGPTGVRGELWDEREPSMNFPSAAAVSSSSGTRPSLTAWVPPRPSKHAARASTSSSVPPSTCTGHRWAAGTSRRSAKTRSSPQGSPPPTCPACSATAWAPPPSTSWPTTPKPTGSPLTSRWTSGRCASCISLPLRRPSSMPGPGW